MAAESCLILYDIEAQNVGSAPGNEHKRKAHYVAVGLKGKTEKTKESSPQDFDGQHGSSWCTKWDERLQFDLGKEGLKSGDIVIIQIFKVARFWDKLLGRTELPVDDLISGRGEKISFKRNLRDGNNRPLEAIFKCTMEHERPGEVRESQLSSALDGEETEEARKPFRETRKEMPRTQLVKEVRLKVPYPEKPRDFQIRIKIDEGRHLSGHNINPVVRVTVRGIKKQTRVESSTNQPYYNQTLSFNFTTKFQELFEEQVKFEVIDSHRIRHDSLIGLYKCDVREIYNFEGHIILRKWILLSEVQENETIIQGGNVTIKRRQGHEASGHVAGYLKVSMAVLEAGMSAPSLEALADANSDDDIESNLLHFPGVSLTSAVFTLTIYRAEDIPQMDHDDLLNRLRKKKKDRADPYCIFSFAGKQAISSVQYDSRSPQFNEKLHLLFKHPSVCEKLKIQLMDKDFGTDDDFIGTIFIPVSHISGQDGNEFLPTFGPCFINMYGSPREYSDWPNKHEELDKGIGEGAAYRGRILVQLKTKLDANKNLEVERIKDFEVVRIQKYMRRQKFCLLAAFLEATMLAVEDAQVQFELSIGNYGNSLDDSVGPCPSTTPPTNPISDGKKYYYLPWGNSKPYVHIKCEFEDISFRLAALNRLLKICRSLEQNIKNIKNLKSAADIAEKQNIKDIESAESISDNKEEYQRRVLDALDSLIGDCESSIPELDPSKLTLTKLDLQMNKTRKEVLKSIYDESNDLKSQLDDPKVKPLPIIESFLKRIQAIAIEPQNSMPDVIIWMIKAERERVAYCRIPANELFHCEDPDERGKNCGKTIDINLKFPGKEDGSHKSKFAGVLRLMVWLGPVEHQGKWSELKNTGGRLSVFAETFENQTYYPAVGWSNKNLSRPAFSNANGTLSLPKDRFEPPEGWKFVSDWQVRPELSTQFSKDAGCKTFIDDVFENEHRYIFGGQWKENESLRWTDRFGNAILNNNNKSIQFLDEIQPPTGWRWSDAEWIVDLERAVDSEGWEYTVEASYGSTDYESSEKTFHFCRRKRWKRERRIIDGVKTEILAKPADKDGWEYALTFKSRFHTQSKPLYCVRRKRLYRLLERDDSSASEPVFILKDKKAKEKDKDKEDQSVLVPPSIILSFKEPIICQLRAYIYQGRNLLPSDPDGLADPYVCLSFGTRSATSERIRKKLNPTWDQMLVLESVPIYGHPEQVRENPPDVVMELFDWDRTGKNEFLGRVQVEPLVIKAEWTKPDTILSWYAVNKGSTKCGDILAAFELYLDENVSAPTHPELKEDTIYPVPRGIRPNTERTAVEVLCWGLRNLRRFHWRKVKSPYIEVEIGTEIKKKFALSNVEGNANFKHDRILCFDVQLPSDAVYLPAVTIQLKASSGQAPIGICVVENLRKFEVDENEPWLLSKIQRNVGTSSNTGDTYVDVENKNDGSKNERASTDTKTDHDWWTTYYEAKNAREEDESKEYLKIYKHSLEEEFENFHDQVKTFKFRRGKMEYFDEDDEDSIVGEFKANLAVYPLKDDFKGELRPKIFNERRLRRMDSVRCLVRVYIVKVYDLVPKDRNGLADPYLMVSLGNETFDNKDDYKADTLDAEFGAVFEFQHAEIPHTKDLNIKVLDYDYNNDDLIGETHVDLENRLLTRRHAIAGLPPTYHESGPSKWMLGEKYTPSFILKQHCEDFGIAHRFSNRNNVLTLQYGNKKHIFDIKDFEDSSIDLTDAGRNMERLSLHVLNSFKDEHQMVPEHVETRDLRNKLFPSFSQGKIEMFIHIIPETHGDPGPPINIRPRKPKQYELRVIVWNTKDVKPQDKNIYGDEMSDIFVKCKLTDVDSQKTDTHYRSLDGDGMFNYRMVFPFEYSETKCKMIVRKKAHFFSRRKYSKEIEPQLVVEVWDNDLFSSNDFIGDVCLNLQNLSKPFGKSKDIKDPKLSTDTNSLFKKGRVRGWWPVAGRPKKKKKDLKSEEDSNEHVLTGKVELTLELLEEDDAKARPAGKGQSEPNQHPVLEKPKRPATSFLWILNPWKSFRYVLWSRFKWYFLGAIVLILILLLIGLFIYSAPGYSVKKLFNA